MAPTLVVRQDALVIPPALTVASYNLYLGADLALLFGARSAEELRDRAAVVRDQLAATRFEERAEALARIIEREQVDVAGLQEVTRWTVGDELVVDFLPVLLDALAATGPGYDAHAVVDTFTGALPVAGATMGITGANVVLVRRGGALSVTGERSGTFATSYVVPTGIAGVAFPIVRGWGWVDGDVGGHPCRVANTHTEAYDPAARDAQRDELLALTDAVAGPVVLLGDLNATPAAVGVPAPYRDAWTAAGGDPDSGLTCGQAPDLANEHSQLRERIDYVFVRDLDVARCTTVGDQPSDRTSPTCLWPSDHAGVVARLRLGETPAAPRG